MNIAYLVSHPTQFEVPLYRYISGLSDLNIDVYYWSHGPDAAIIDPELGHETGWSDDVDENYKYFVLPKSLFGYLVYLLQNIFVKNKYNHVILNGYTGRPIIVAIVLAVLIRYKNLAIRSDTTLLYKRSFLKNILRYFYIKFISILVKSFMVTGTLAKQHLEYYGVDDSRIYYFPYSVDNESIRSTYEIYQKDRSILKSKHNIANKSLVFLAVIKFVEREGILELIKSIKLLKDNDKLSFLIVGDGNLMDEVRRFLEINNITNVQLPGYVSYSELPKYYTLADVFIHPAIHEPWGVSVNEAMVCGMPVITSDKVGAAYDLIEIGINGFIYESGNSSQLSDCVIKFTEMPQKDIENMGKESYRIINSWNYHEIVSEFKRLAH